MVQDIVDLIEMAKGHVTFRTIKNYFPKADKQTVMAAIALWLDSEAK